MAKQPSASSDKSNIQKDLLATDESSNVNEDLSAPVTASIPAKVPAMTIRLVSKNDKFKSIIIDAFRILSWEQFRSEYKVTGLEGYEKFYELWVNHEVHEMSYIGLQKLYTSLDYTMSDLVKIRNDYYAKRRKVNDEGSQEIVRESDQYSFGDDLAF